MCARARVRKGGGGGGGRGRYHVVTGSKQAVRYDTTVITS